MLKAAMARVKEDDVVFLGTVASFSFERGYGFIHEGNMRDCTGDRCKNCTFVHHQGLVRGSVPERSGKKTLHPGADVFYERSEGEKGPVAINVRVVGWRP